MTTPALSLLSREDYESLYADGDFTGPGTVLPLDFIEAFGFASYNFTVYKTRIFENQLQTRDGRSAGASMPCLIRKSYASGRARRCAWNKRGSHRF
ncbi:hypothetical protein E6W36_11805 [Hankyongella ginsenosidimutans]|uniref:Uncharacterized protein n=1 Tax=Hankyongella ginsenosidimutans TaxID=1763828 RepID=A0A4D7C2L7_9SPHN|nr:hypothetical protein [Hankyongella ginsenosidimutans]QCI79944.1 hypothetical protein E6W36_11805 [Hankyongella ginsenosidimutans]